MENAIHSPQFDEPVEAATTLTGSTDTNVINSNDDYNLPDPIPILDAKKITLRRSIDHQQAQQFAKADFGHLFSRIFEVKSSLFDKKHLRPLNADEERRSTPTVSGEWTFV